MSCRRDATAALSSVKKEASPDPLGRRALPWLAKLFAEEPSWVLERLKENLRAWGAVASLLSRADMQLVRRVFHGVLRLVPRDDVHGLGHVARVLGYSLAIAERLEERGEELDATCLVVAALLHDVGRYLEHEEHHAVVSARYAERLLRELGAPESLVECVVECILAHSYTLGVEPSRLEAKVLSDADKLDAMGGIGAARAFAEGERRGRGFQGTLDHFREKLVRLYGTLRTREARELADELGLRKFTEMVVEQIEKEQRLLENYLRAIEGLLSS